MIINNIFFSALFFLSTISPMFAMQDKTRELHNNSENDFVANAFIGSAAGAGEALFNQPVITVKNALQQQKPITPLLKSPALLYRGLGVSVACSICSTAPSMAVSQRLKEIMPHDDMQSVLARNGLAGASSALLCNPCELVIINQQNWKASAGAATQRLYQENGVQVAVRGYTAKAAREGIFCAGFLTAYPIVKEKLKRERELDGLPGTIAATALVGPPTAVATHPFDTISTRMQADASKKQFQGFWDTAKKIYAQGGLRACGAGLLPRTARIMIAIPLMTEVSNRLKKASYRAE